MRGNKEAGEDQFKTVVVLNKPYCGEAGVIVGLGSNRGSDVRRPRQRFSGDRSGRRGGPGTGSFSYWYKVMLLDPKYKDRVIKVPSSQVYCPEDEDWVDQGGSGGTGLPWWMVRYNILPGEQDEDYVTKVLLESALEKKMSRLRFTDLEGLDVPAGDRVLYGEYSRRGRWSGRG